MLDKKITVMQMIDSLDVGGAERVCVNYANALFTLDTQYKSHICVTRGGGPLEEFIKPGLDTFMMQKKSMFDRQAYSRAIRYVKENDIEIIHAHTGSYLTALIIQFFTPVKVIWHDHHGQSAKIKASLKFKIRTQVLKLLSRRFSYVITVNKLINEWVEKNLYVRKGCIEYLPNYAELYLKDESLELPGTKDTRIVSLANLRPVKDHLNLIKAFDILYKEGFTQWHVLLVGSTKDKVYLEKVNTLITQYHLENNIHILGVRSDAADILNECSIGVITSETEGLPMALLEYGLASLSVVSTRVGECPKVLEEGTYGLIAEVKDSKDLADKLRQLLSSGKDQGKYSKLFYQHVQDNYSKNAVLDKLLKIYEKVML
ncbi:MAG: hypothetical protein COA44_00595 [Arcobacter sp.]|nr:MAG: hypothetical protein COA44_00595 [Arcobacter sp.]